MKHIIIQDRLIERCRILEIYIVSMIEISLLLCDYTRSLLLVCLFDLKSIPALAKAACVGFQSPKPLTSIRYHHYPPHVIEVWYCNKPWSLIWSEPLVAKAILLYNVRYMITSSCCLLVHVPQSQAPVISYNCWRPWFVPIGKIHAC